MDNTILKHLLRYDFWLANTSVLSASLFSDTHRELYEVIVASHEKHKSDLSGTEVLALWRARFPVATRTEVEEVEGVVQDIQNAAYSSDSLITELITSLWQREVGTKIANMGIAISEGKQNSFDKLASFVENAKNGFLPTDFEAEVTKDISELITLTGDESRYRFNIKALSDCVYGIGHSEYMIVYARPETGKTAFGVSLAAAPNGFLHQGARVFIGGNEEDPRRTMLRAVQAWTGLPREAIIARPEYAKQVFAQISDNLHIMGIHGWTLDRLKAYLDILKPDVTIVDQMDKIGLVDRFDSGHERLRALYTRGRDIAGELNTAWIALSQASVEAEGKTIVLPDMTEGSKTGKYAEGDLMIGIGKYPVTADGDDPIRFLTVGKNKLNGFHGTVSCKIEPEISRYVD